MARERKKKDRKKAKDDNTKATTMSARKYVIEKDGKTLEYSSLEEMPPDVRRFHEQVQAFINGKPTEIFGGRDPNQAKITTKTKTTYRFKGKNYKKIEDIPDEKTRAMFKALEHQSNGKSNELLPGKKILVTPDGQVREVRDVSDKVWCPGCGNKIIPAKTFFGKYKCPQCKMKWAEGEFV